MAKIKTNAIGLTDATFKATSGRELRLRATDAAVHAELDLGGGDSSTVWRDGPEGAAEAAELRAVLDAIAAGEKARLRLLQIAADHERRVMNHVSARDAETD